MNKFIEKIGMDKVAHFGVGGLITALFTIVLMMQDLPVFLAEPWRILILPIAGTIVTAFVSVIKELFFDGQRDWKDLYVALIGSSSVYIAVFFGFLFFLGSN